MTPAALFNRRLHNDVILWNVARECRRYEANTAKRRRNEILANLFGDLI